jgi:TatA/E family protein of Tat protein translocase
VFSLLEELLQPRHLLIILIVALVFFGPKKLPELGNALGRTFKEFKVGIRGTLKEEEQSPKVFDSGATIVNTDNQKTST